MNRLIDQCKARRIVMDKEKNQLGEQAESCLLFLILCSSVATRAMQHDVEKKINSEWDIMWTQTADGSMQTYCFNTLG